MDPRLPPNTTKVPFLIFRLKYFLDLTESMVLFSIDFLIGLPVITIFSFGKYKGQEVLNVFKKDPGYYGWILKSDFPLYTKKILTSIKLSNKEF